MSIVIYCKKCNRPAGFSDSHGIIIDGCRTCDYGRKLFECPICLKKCLSVIDLQVHRDFEHE